jgi:phosphogluconate dehydratase
MNLNKTSLNSHLQHITSEIVTRSTKSRAAYLARMQAAKAAKPSRSKLPCGNFAHGIAACDSTDKLILRTSHQPNIAIVSAYNDMLSAHQPYHCYPDQIKETIRELGGVAQFAGGVPAMCDGVTQGEAGMELSLFSRDVIAMSVAVALSHNMFDGVVMLGVCDKIAPGMLIGALSFGFLPMAFLPAGPMPSGLPNKEKARVRQQFAQGDIDREGLLKAETESYHSPGTCTFYGTANSNQMLMEIMGLQLPGSSFVNPNTPIRKAFTEAGCSILYSSIDQQKENSLADIISEKTIINGIVGLLATGGSSNHTLHILAMAQAAGIQITWRDIAKLSAIVPLIARVYPNGDADINHFHQTGGMAYVINELLSVGLLHDDVKTVMGDGLSHYTQDAALASDHIVWTPSSGKSTDTEVLRTADDPFQTEGGLQLLTGNLGHAIIKTSAVNKDHLIVSAPARVFTDQQAVLDEFKQGKLNQDVMVVLKGQGPKANGMPELHKLTPVLGVLQDQGYRVALVTDGRMSGASGKVPAAIHVSPEAMDGGTIDRIQDGDLIVLDAIAGTIELKVSEITLAERLSEAESNHQTGAGNHRHQYNSGCGRELFAPFRQIVGSATQGASIFGDFGFEADLQFEKANKKIAYKKEVTE